MKKGFSLIELLVVIAVLGAMVITVLVVLDPIQALAKTKDAGRISAIIQLGKTLESYSVSQAGKVPVESSNWLDELVRIGEITNKTSQIDYVTSGTTACEGNNQNNYCYKTADGGGEGPFLVYARLESKANSAKCGFDEWAFIVYSSADASAGIVCSSQGNSNLVSGNQSFATSFNVSGCKNSQDKVQVVIPNGKEIYTVGDTIKIQWCLNDYSIYNQYNAYVTLSSRQGESGSYVYQNQTTISSKLDMKPGLNTFEWVIPSDSGLEGGSFVILVNPGSNGQANYDYSDDVFTINQSSTTGSPSDKGGCASSDGNVEVIIPNGGGNFNVGDKLEIIWCLNDFSQYNKTYTSIWLVSRETQSSGAFIYRNQVQINKNFAMNPGLNSFSWTIPEMYGGETYLISVSSNSISPNIDYSDNTFSIKNSSITSLPPNDVSCSGTTGRVSIVNPNNGESYKAGDKINFKWCVNNYSEYNQNYSRITISSASGASYTVSSNTPMKAGGNQLEWTIPLSAVPGNYTATVSINSWYPTNYDLSDKTFSIISP